MEQKKISFSFNRLSKKTNIISNNVKQNVNKVELVECLEGQSIKVKDVVEEVKQPLIIPIKDNQKNLLDRIRDAKKRDRLLDQKKTESEDNRPDSELTVDEVAARQLIREAKDRLAQRNIREENKVSVLPLNQETPTLEGEKEPTLEDYESVPIGDYGLALLRGMGWKEGMTVGKNSSKAVNVSAPELRPKGLGLGATKVVQSEIPTKRAVDKDGKELILVKGAFAKVIAGGKKGSYCEVQGFDEEAGRVIVKVYPKGENLNVNEFMLIPVTKEEFSKGSKILNNAKYEEYLEISEKKLEKYKIKQEPLTTKTTKEEHTGNPKLVTEEYSKYRAKNDKSTDSSKSSDERDGHLRNKHKSESSDGETERKHRNHTKSKYRDRSRSRSPSRHKSKKDKNSRRSLSDSDHHEKEKKSSKHSKSKYRDRSQDESGSREKHKKDKKHKSRSRRDSSSSESESKQDKRKKNKCKSRHRRNSSSSSTDRKTYRSKK